MLASKARQRQLIEQSEKSAEKQELYTTREAGREVAFNESAFLHDAFFENVETVDDVLTPYKVWLSEQKKAESKEVKNTRSAIAHMDDKEYLKEHSADIMTTSEFIRTYKADDLRSLKNDDLKILCKSFGIPYSGLNKSGLVSALLGYQSAYISITQSDDIKKGGTDIYTITDFLFRSGKIDSICRHIIKKTAGAQNQQSSACNDIVKNSFRDALYDDIKQELSMELFNMFKEGECFFNPNTMRIEYKEHEDKHGNKTSSYINLYKALRRTIASYKYESRNKTSDIDYNSGYEQIELADILNSNNDVIGFFRWLKEEDSKNYHLYVTLVPLLFENADIKTIADTLEVKERKVKYLKDKLFSLACSYFEYDGNYEVHHIEYLKRADKKGSVIIKNNKDTITGETINFADVEKWHSTKKLGIRRYKTEYVLRIHRGYRKPVYKSPKLTKLAMIAKNNDVIVWNGRTINNPFTVLGTTSRNAVKPYGMIKGIPYAMNNDVIR